MVGKSELPNSIYLETLNFQLPSQKLQLSFNEDGLKWKNIEQKK